MRTTEDFKVQAKLLRKHLATRNIELRHSEALEAVSAIHGYKDWNTASALLVNPEDPLIKAARKKAMKDLPCMLDKLRSFFQECDLATPRSLLDAACNRPLLDQGKVPGFSYLNALTTWSHISEWSEETLHLKALRKWRQNAQP